MYININVYCIVNNRVRNVLDRVNVLLFKVCVYRYCSFIIRYKINVTC